MAQSQFTFVIGTGHVKKVVLCTMKKSQKTLLHLLENENKSFSDLSEHNSITNAELFVSSALLVTVMGFLKEQLWLACKEDGSLKEEGNYKNFISPLFNDVLSEIEFLRDFLIKSGPKKLKRVLKIAEMIESEVIEFVLDSTQKEQKEFATHSLKLMKEHFLKEELDQEGREQSLGHKGLRLYRTFDNLDMIFDLDYQLDREMKVDHETTERLYQRAGVGVQSGYSTILLALHQINIDESISSKSKVVDLGSGYGRVGLVCSLLSSDLEFIGYEYVPHRVDVANRASQHLGIDENLEFITQDLSLETFSIPEADVYYLYDPFSKETYHYILHQIVEMSKLKPIMVITKGNANHWLEEIALLHKWPKPKFIDEGNLCIFKSS